MSKEQWSKSAIYSLIYLFAGSGGILLSLTWLIVSLSPSVWQFLVLATLLTLFSAVTLGGVLSLRQSLAGLPLSKFLQQYHRISLLLSTFVWLVCMPALLGLGLGQLFFTASGFVLFVLPSLAMMIMQKISILPPKNEKKSWNDWVASDAIQADDDG
jgi:hypothetical protein